ncbi:uncharacterized protein B0H18DRAFT_1122559 [Fomitopsis serialis]|uniref:uncharacterized protein n=1 Tax=Fomitopsis serialis TaxID=139415 RepID=UPI0020084BBC|nr:uncharacterized protein B0H18DRAFT_1122559 [Neoantrodia serialis]KAH9919299.1 hypothetical protein B0H18DRAFT_1122559 [Neoantrodia serialis]
MSDTKDGCTEVEVLIHGKDTLNDMPNEKRSRIAGTHDDGLFDTENPRLRLSLLLALPLEVMLEIISLLKPLDLANLAQTDKAFRAMIMSPLASKTWTAARKFAGNAPECPPRVSEVSWARFLYGSTKW